MSLRRSASRSESTTDSSATPGDQSTTQFRENPQVNAKIDDYIKNNPKHWDYIQSMPRERLERALVLQEVQKQDRTQKMRAGIMRKLEQDPELKQAYENLVKNLPEDQREQAMINIASRTMRDIAPRQSQKAGGVKV
jgi:hypothetical protein